MDRGEIVELLVKKYKPDIDSPDEVISKMLSLCYLRCLFCGYSADALLCTWHVHRDILQLFVPLSIVEQT